MRIGALVRLGVLVVMAACANTPHVPAPVVPQVAAVATSTGSMTPGDIEREVIYLRDALAREVPQHINDTPEARLNWISRAKAVAAASGFVISRVQLVVVVDRNPAVQELRIILVRPDKEWQVIGGSKVSTGQAGRRGYFITPVGVFLHTDGILDFRALGTFNENHIRGLGLKGMRVWDFGWQTAERGWRADRDEADIRLQMHATDPDYLEQRLGRPASEGCVRIPATMNRFLDRHGVLDADYERDTPHDPRLESVLLPDRVPTPLAGDAMIVVDSAQPAQ